MLFDVPKELITFTGYEPGVTGIMSSVHESPGAQYRDIIDGIVKYSIESFTRSELGIT